MFYHILTYVIELWIEFWRYYYLLSNINQKVILNQKSFIENENLWIASNWIIQYIIIRLSFKFNSVSN